MAVTYAASAQLFSHQRLSSSSIIKVQKNARCSSSNDCQITSCDVLATSALRPRYSVHRKHQVVRAHLQGDSGQKHAAEEGGIPSSNPASACNWNGLPARRVAGFAGWLRRGRGRSIVDKMVSKAASQTTPLEEAQPDEAALRVEEGKRQFSLALPIFGTQMVQLLLVLSSSVFVGRLGEFPLAVSQLGISLGNATGHYVLNGLALGLETLCGQSFGGSELMEVGRTIQCALIIQTIMAVVISVLWLKSEPLLLALNQEPALASAAGRYLKLLIPGLLANACLQPLVKYLQSLEMPRPLAVCSGVALAFHVPINWLLIYHLGLGLDGAAIATSIAYIVNLVLLAGYTVSSGVYKSSWPKWSWASIQKSGLFLKLAVPSMIMLCLEYLTYDILIIWCGWLPNPTRMVASFSVALNTAWLFATLYIGFSSALSTRIATELGAGDYDGAKRVASVGMPLAASIGVGCGLLLLFVHRWWPRIFVDPADVALFKLTSQVILTYGVVCIQDCLSFNLGGIVRGLGRQDTGAAITFSSYYLIALPLAWFLCFKRNMGVFGLMAGVSIGLLFQIAALGTMVYRTDWDKMAEQATVPVALLNGS